MRKLIQKREFMTRLGLFCFSLVGFSRSAQRADDCLKKSKKETLLVHQVYFWLKKDLTPQQILIFEKGLQDLVGIKSVMYGNFGKPGPTKERAVVDHSYSYALLTIFSNLASHDAYQSDPIHIDFLGNCKDFWEKVIVYDTSTLNL